MRYALPMSLFRKHFFAVLLAGCGSGDDNNMMDSGPDVADASITDSKPDTVKMDAMPDAFDGSSIDTGSDTSSDDAADASSDSALFDGSLDGGVKSLGGLALWLEASMGVTKNNQNQVSVWADQSGNGNDAKQNTMSQQPTYGASVINSLPAIHFTAMNKTVMQIVDAATLQWGTGDFLVEVVARYDNAAMSYGMLYWKANGTGVAVASNDLLAMTTGFSAGVDINDLVGVNASYNDNTPRNYGFRRTGTTLELRVQGAVGSSKTEDGGIDVSAASTNVAIGDTVFGNYALDGDIAEIVAVKGSISMQDLGALEAYFKSKYNL
jgi:hypothetical protein